MEMKHKTLQVEMKHKTPSGNKAQDTTKWTQNTHKREIQASKKGFYRENAKRSKKRALKNEEKLPYMLSNNGERERREREKRWVK